MQAQAREQPLAPAELKENKPNKPKSPLETHWAGTEASEIFMTELLHQKGKRETRAAAMGKEQRQDLSAWRSQIEFQMQCLKRNFLVWFCLLGRPFPFHLSSFWFWELLRYPGQLLQIKSESCAFRFLPFHQLNMRGIQLKACLNAQLIVCKSWQNRKLSFEIQFWFLWVSFWGNSGNPTFCLSACGCGK